MDGQNNNYINDCEVPPKNWLIEDTPQLIQHLDKRNRAPVIPNPALNNPYINNPNYQSNYQNIKKEGYVDSGSKTMATMQYQTPPIYPRSDNNSPRPIVQARPKIITTHTQQQQQPIHHLQMPSVSRNITLPLGPKKKALIVACNYPGTPYQLSGCIKDAEFIQYMLITKFNYKPENILVLRDDDKKYLPTRKNIMDMFKWLVSGANSGDSLFFHFSGHGSQKRDYTGDEEDGYNETLLPTDHKIAGQIIDDDINVLLVNPLPYGVYMHCVIDACHSGTAMDLKYTAKIKKGNYAWKDTGITKKYKGTQGGVCFQFGACKDSELAQDSAGDNAIASGAATYSFVRAIERGGTGQSYANLLTMMQDFLNENGKLSGIPGKIIGVFSKYVNGIGIQKPQLSCNIEYDLNSPLRI